MNVTEALTVAAGVIGILVGTRVLLLDAIKKELKNIARELHELRTELTASLEDHEQRIRGLERQELLTERRRSRP